MNWQLPVSAPHFILAAQGESKAQQFLQLKGYVVMGKNVRCGRYELDIICLDPVCDEVVFVEVKTRSSQNYGSPALAVNHRKRAALIKAARTYIRAHRLEKAFRFDIISVLPNKIEHFKNITW